MKTRQTLVSNSSSSSFIFLFKGDDIDDLCKMIAKYHDHFHHAMYISEDCHYKCTASDVIAKIKEAAKVESEDEWKTINIKNTKDYLEEVKVRVKECQKRVDEPDEDVDEWYVNYEHQILSELYGLEIGCKQALKNGLNKVVVIDFGDNHGQVQGGDVGHCMHYQGCNIELHTNDFEVFVENNH